MGIYILAKCSMTTSLTLKYMRLTGVEVKPIIMCDGWVKEFTIKCVDVPR